jgi:hypothetical protein
MITGVAYSATAAEGVSIEDLPIDANATEIDIAINAKPLTPTGSATTIDMKFAVREIPLDGSTPIGSWTQYDLFIVNLGVSEAGYRETASGKVALSTFGLTAGKRYQAQLIRDPLGTDDNTFDYQVRTCTITIS